MSVQVLHVESSQSPRSRLAALTRTFVKPESTLLESAICIWKWYGGGHSFFSNSRNNSGSKHLLSWFWVWILKAGFHFSQDNLELSQQFSELSDLLFPRAGLQMSHRAWPALLIIEITLILRKKSVSKLLKDCVGGNWVSKLEINL